MSKGERTRRSLLAACRSAFSELGYHDTKIADICARAGVSAGTFYVYFKDKDELAAALIEQITEENMAKVLASPRGPHPFDSILAANRSYIEAIARNGTLNRAISQMVDTLPPARQTWMKANHRFAESIARSTGDAPQGAAHKGRLFSAMAAQAMLDQVLIQYFAWEDGLLKTTGGSLEELAERLSIVWYRIIFAADPPLSRLRKARSMALRPEAED